jgi:hypothetical protein
MVRVRKENGFYLTKPPEFPLLKDIIDRGKSLNFCQEGSDYVLRRAA